MIVDFAQLKTSLKNKVEPAYMIYGTDYFLLQKAVQLVQQALPNAEISKFDATVPGDAVVAALMTTSFFNTERIVIAYLDDKTSLTAINQYLKNPVVGNVLLLVFFSEKPPLTVKNATLVNCNPMPESILIPLIAKQIAPKNITREAAAYLVAATGGYYTLIDNELTKLLAYYEEIPLLELAHLQPHLTKTLDYQIYELGAAILKGDVMVAPQILQFLLASNYHEYLIFGGIVTQLRRAYYATATTGDINTVGKILGCSPFAIKYSRRDFGGHPQNVKMLYALALTLEYQIKAGQTTAVNALQSLIYR